MDRKRQISVLFIMILAAVNLLVLYVLFGSRLEQKLLDRLVDDSVSVTEEGNITAPDNDTNSDWQGWQKAVVRSENAVLCSDRELTVPLNVEAAPDETVIVIEKSGGSCRIRCGESLGWIAAEDLTLTGEPVSYTDVEASAQPQSLRGTDIASELDSAAQKYGCIGVQMAVISDGQVRWLYEYGYQNKAQKSDMTADTKLYVAGVSSAVNAMGILSMRDMELLELDADVSDYWTAAIKNPYHTDSAITLRHMLTHTSSLLDFGSKKRETSALEEKLQLSTSYLKAVPGENGTYKLNNTAIGAAAAIAGSAAGCNFDRFVREYYFAPMGIDASFWAGNIRSSTMIAPMYQEDAVIATVRDLQDISFYGGAADDYSLYSEGMIISAQDLARMVCILLNGGQEDGVYYMSRQSVSDMLAVYCSADGGSDQCLVLKRNDGLLNRDGMYYLNGSLLGVHSLLCFNAETGDGLVVVTNGAKGAELSDGVYNICGELAETAASLWQ